MRRLVLEVLAEAVGEALLLLPRAALEELRAEPGERLDRLEQRVAALGSADAQGERLARLERTVAELEAALTALREELGA